MLKRQHRRRRQHRHLLRIRNRLERRAHRYFRFPVSNVAAQQPVHRQRRFHVPLHILNGAMLISGLLELKCIVEFALTIRLRWKRVPHRRFSFCVNARSWSAISVDRLLHSCLARFPGRAAQPVQLRLYAAERLVFLHQIDPRQRDINFRVVRVSQ